MSTYFTNFNIEECLSRFHLDSQQDEISQETMSSIDQAFKNYVNEIVYFRSHIYTVAYDDKSLFSYSSDSNESGTSIDSDDSADSVDIKNNLNDMNIIHIYTIINLISHYARYPQTELISRLEDHQSQQNIANVDNKYSKQIIKSYIVNLMSRFDQNLLFMLAAAHNHHHHATSQECFNSSMTLRNVYYIIYGMVRHKTMLYDPRLIDIQPRYVHNIYQNLLIMFSLIDNADSAVIHRLLVNEPNLLINIIPHNFNRDFMTYYNEIYTLIVGFRHRIASYRRDHIILNAIYNLRYRLSEFKSVSESEIIYARLPHIVFQNILDNHPDRYRIKYIKIILRSLLNCIPEEIEKSEYAIQVRQNLTRPINPNFYLYWEIKVKKLRYLYNLLSFVLFYAEEKDIDSSIIFTD